MVICLVYNQKKGHIKNCAQSSSCLCFIITNRNGLYVPYDTQSLNPQCCQVTVTVTLRHHLIRKERCLNHILRSRFLLLDQTSSPSQVFDSTCTCTLSFCMKRHLWYTYSSKYGVLCLRVSHCHQELCSLLGKGGFGTVYKGYVTALWQSKCCQRYFHGLI